MAQKKSAKKKTPAKKVIIRKKTILIPGPPGPPGPVGMGYQGPRGHIGPPGISYDEANTLIDKLLTGLRTLFPPKVTKVGEVSITVTEPVPVAEITRAYTKEAPPRADGEEGFTI